MSEEKKENGEIYFTYFKQLYEKWEKSMSHALDVWMKSSVFSRRTEQASQKAKEFQNYMYETMRRALETRYYPMKSDVERIFETLEALEDKLARLEVKIGALEGLRQAEEKAEAAAAPEKAKPKGSAKPRRRGKKQ